MTGNNKHLSILTLNVNGLNVPIKRHIIAYSYWIKNRTQPFIAYKRLISLKNINTGLESKGERSFPSKWGP
jgi:hypothetical protein